jgi:hypothetical protein
MVSFFFFQNWQFMKDVEGPREKAYGTTRLAIAGLKTEFFVFFLFLF